MFLGIYTVYLLIFYLFFVKIAEKSVMDKLDYIYNRFLDKLDKYPSAIIRSTI